MEANGEVQECMDDELDSGVSCESGDAACGRPDDFTDPQFYLPIDLQVRPCFVAVPGFFLC